MATIVDNHSGRFAGEMTNATKELVFGAVRTIEDEDTGESIRTRALGLYLQAKMGQLLGIRPDEVLLGTPLSIPAQYNNSEGVINTMRGEPGFVQGLRIDLQKAQVINGHTYATFQVQWGTGSDGKKGGAYAGALMRTDTPFNVGDLREALVRSEGTRTYWRIDP